MEQHYKCVHTLRMCQRKCIYFPQTKAAEKYSELFVDAR